MYLHSSGSTGLPKAIPIPHATLLDRAHFGCTNGMFTGVVAAFTLPPFGVAGVACQILAPLFAGHPSAVFPPALNPSSPITLTADNVMVYMRRNKLTSMIVFPAFLHKWAKDEAAVKYLCSLDNIGYAGGPLLPSIGQTLVEQGVNIKAIYASTEIGGASLYDGIAAKEDWEYFEWNPLLKLRLFAKGDGSYEAHVLSTDQQHLPIIDTPDKLGFDLPDLFEKHPTKEGLWRILGRKDDVFIDATGVNVVPGPMEAVVNSNPHVATAVMFGQHRMQSGILIQLNESGLADDVDETILRDHIWQSIEEGNRIVQNYARINKSMILFTTLSKPLPLKVKGLVRRKDALKLYEHEIDTLYSNAEKAGGRYEIAAL
ncbi:hypothetical protein HGRIS_006399 [Hohenbuehelia grisea]|uniref:AMP-dependent synthetase/ligase domain-containing protein n=1 Tax=Hohenbuehelia grisea TaxID=104357 RepID=A0ABR3K111_9AGAR